MKQSLSILAKDRHIVQRLQKSLKHAFDPKDQKKLDDIIARSHQSFVKRLQSVPSQLAESLNHELPVSQVADTLIQAIKEHQVIIVAGETGSGKTTQLPKLAMLAGRGIAGQIGHTQPRRLAARSVATRIAEELGEPLGQTVSFKVRFNEEGGSHSLIKVMTDGILLAELAYDKYLSRYDTIIIDEAHERSLNIDFIMGYLKSLLPKRPDLKVIITSATLDTERFASYFNHKGKPAPIYVVEGRSYPVEVRYRPLMEDKVAGLDDDSFDEFEDKLPRALVSAVEECVADARQKNVLGDILVFCATEAQIFELADILKQYAPPHTEVLTLFARQSMAEQARIFSVGSGRRIILSTNVAETALTVPNIRYVIDLGFARISRYNYRSRVQRLPIEAISQAAANQRKGRCGRLSDGVCIRLYSQEDFDSRPQFTEPEILRTNLASVILQMTYLGLGQIDEFDFITPPDFRLINDGKKLLHELSAISDRPTKTAFKKGRASDTTLTAIGKQMAKMPIDPRLARMLIASVEFDCVADMLIIVSALAVQDIRERPVNKQAQADQKHALFRGENSDFLFYINAFKALFDKHELNDLQVLSSNGRKSFAKKHFFSFPRVREWQKTHSQLSQMMATLGFDIQKTPSVFEIPQGLENIDKKERPRLGRNAPKTTANHPITPPSDNPTAVHYANLHRALLTGLLSFIAQKTDVKGEYLMAKNHKARLFPASTLHKKGMEWVMAFEVVETSQVYMRTLAKIEPEWIIASSGELLKYHYFEPHWSKKTGRVKAYAQISLFGLVIVAKQLVNYEKINADEARDIFIQDALVLNHLGVQLPFLSHNQAKIEQAMLAEDKLRRRDLLADEERLYQFYDSKLPKHIVSRKGLQDFLGECSDDEFLRFDDTDVFNDTACSRDFPESWRVGALQLPLSYVFDPSSDDDGVSVKVPKEALAQLDAVALLWGIAPWRYELVVALLKTLPKEYRRHIVPIPDTAKKIVDKLDANKPIGLLDQLCQVLLGFGIKAVPNEFKLEQIDNYLQPLICVVNAKGQVIDKSRDLQKLQLKYRSTLTTANTISQGAYEKFPEHFYFAKHKHISGVALQEFLALSADMSANSTAVDIHHFSDLQTALITHKTGVLTLIKAQLSSRQKQLTSQIDKAFKMAFAPLGDLEKLKTLLVNASLQVAFDDYAPNFEKNPNSEENKIRQSLIEQNLLKDNTYAQELLAHLPLSAQEFEMTKEQILMHFLQAGQIMLKVLKEIYTTWQTVRGQLLMLDNDTFGESIADIEDQLDDLCLGEFIYKVDSSIWKNYPRYLSAIKTRIERLPNNLDADLAGVYQLDVHMERLANCLHDKRMANYRWGVEELRINLFAQPMKTLYPISDKRLHTLWDKIHTR